MLVAITEWLLGLITTLGYPGLVLAMFLENVFPPLPSEMVLPLAGSLTVHGPFSLPGVILSGSLGSLAGTSLFYAVGRWYGEERLRRFVRRYERWLFLSEADLNRLIRFFQRHGAPALLFGRMVPGIRSLISLPAGMACLKGATFAIYTTLGTVAWNLVLALTGRVLGRSWPLVLDFMDHFQTAILIVIAAALALLVTRRLARRRSPEADRNAGEE